MITSPIKCMLMKIKIALAATLSLTVWLWPCVSSQAQTFVQDGSLNTAVTSANSSSVSTSFTVSAGAQVLVVSLMDRNQSLTAATNGASPSSLLWGTQTISRVVSQNNLASHYADSDIYYLWNPTPGMQTITATDTTGSTPSAMTMQVFTLSGVNTNVAPATYGIGNADVDGIPGNAISVTLAGSTPAGAWAVVNASGGDNGTGLAISSSSGVTNWVHIDNNQSQVMGAVENLSGGVATITASDPTQNGTQVGFAVAVFAPGVSTPAPTNVVATGQLNQVALSWDDASGGVATNYIVLRSTTSGTGYSAIVTNTSNAATNYTDTSVTPWTTYYYLVRAVAAAGASGYSAQASAVPLGLPATPTGLTASPGNAQAVLTWNAETGAANFNVLRSTTSGSGFSMVASVTTTNYTDSPLVNGTVYYYELNATNSFGASPNTPQVSVTPSSVVLANAHVVINATNVVRIADTRWFGINASVYCQDFNLQDGVPEVTKAGWTTVRYPGGSIANTYHWATPDSVSGNCPYRTFATVATNLGATVIMTANYGSGTPAEAAALVADANITNHYGFKYWEIGNELYGTYETDNNASPHDPHCYATNAAVFLHQMKAMDPTIKVGVVICSPTNPNDESNGYTNYPATNLISGQVVTGWTPVVMGTLRQLGVTPDFAIFHYYPEDYPYVGDNDQELLAGTISTDSGGTWAANASGLRGLITDYFGPGGTNIELLITENNSEEGTVGKQSVSLVNGLYYCDSLGQIMQTEFNSRVWWDLTDAEPVTTGDLATNLYGWRQYGDLGVMMTGVAQPFTNRYPQYFAAALVSHFARGGDAVVQATSDNALVSAYAALRTNGNLTLLALNKEPFTNMIMNVALTNLNPTATATVYSYGMPQDNAAAAANNACDIATNSVNVGANFNYTLPPYSANVFVFTLQPAAPSLSVLPFAGPGQFVLQLAGQTNVPYVLQSSPDLYHWTPVATDTLTSSVLDVTNAVAPGTGQQFWRAVWSP